MADNRWGAFDRVDATGDPGDFVRYLDTTRGTPFFWGIKARTIALLDTQPGGRFLDVGCGTGDDVLALAGLAGRGWAARG